MRDRIPDVSGASKDSRTSVRHAGASLGHGTQRISASVNKRRAAVAAGGIAVSIVRILIHLEGPATASSDARPSTYKTCPVLHLFHFFVEHPVFDRASGDC